MKSWRIYPDENKDLKSRLYLKRCGEQQRHGVRLCFAFVPRCSVLGGTPCEWFAACGLFGFYVISVSVLKGSTICCIYVHAIIAYDVQKYEKVLKAAKELANKLALL